MNIKEAMEVITKLERRLNIEQGGWAEADKYKEENIQLKKQLAQRPVVNINIYTRKIYGFEI